MAREDFLEALLGAGNGFLQGFQGARAQRGLLEEKMAQRRMAKRKLDDEERAAKAKEFETFGAPLDVIEQGEQLGRSPTYAKGGMMPRGIRVGAAPRPEEDAAAARYDAFTKRLDRKGNLGGTSLYDPNTGKFIDAPAGTKVLPRATGAGIGGIPTPTLKSRMEKLESNELTLDEGGKQELQELRAEWDRRRGAGPRPAGPVGKSEDGPSWFSSMLEKVQGKKKSSGLVGLE